MSTYADLTYNTKNPLARFSHRKRLKISVSMFSNTNVRSLLDFGCGDGKFLKEIYIENPKINLLGYEPVMEIDKDNGLNIVSKLSKINQKFDCVTCFEVLEHFSAKEQLILLNQIKNYVKKGGVVIISVPIEISFPSLVKNIRRYTRSKDIKIIKEIGAAFFGNYKGSLRNKKGYIFSHIGFSHKRLEVILKNEFSSFSKEYSPFSKLPYHFNSQVFYKLKV